MGMRRRIVAVETFARERGDLEHCMSVYSSEVKDEMDAADLLVALDLSLWGREDCMCS